MMKRVKMSQNFEYFLNCIKLVQYLKKNYNVHCTLKKIILNIVCENIPANTMQLLKCVCRIACM